VFDACRIYPQQAWTNANDKMTVKDYIFLQNIMHREVWRIPAERCRISLYLLWGTGRGFGPLKTVVNHIWLWVCWASREPFKNGPTRQYPSIAVDQRGVRRWRRLANTTNRSLRGGCYVDWWSPEFGAQFQRDLSLFLKIPEFPFNT